MAAVEELELLRRQLKEKDEQLRQAAEAGLQLLTEKVELQGRLNDQRVEMTNTIEALEQDKYSLQKNVALKTRMLESLQSEYECVKLQQKQQLQEQQEHLERNHSLALSELHNKVAGQQAYLEEARLSEQQLRHKLEVQTETLNNQLQEQRALSLQTQSCGSAEVMEVQRKVMHLENMQVELERGLLECQHREEQLLLINSNMQLELQRVTEEKEEREKEAVSWFNAVEKSREANRDLQVQLDQVLREAQDPNSRGNSLFAELEDKRAEMEKQLIGMRVQYQSLQKAHAFNKEQMQRLKVQIATLMQLQGSGADPAQLERLQHMLSEKNGELQSLLSKLRRLEKVEMKSRPAAAAPSEDSDHQDESYYSDLLKLKLNNAVKEAERLGEELSLQRMKSVSESQRVLELERKLFMSQRLLKQAQSDLIRLQLRVEEMQLKYEPKAVRKDLHLKRRKEKLPVDVAPSSETGRAVAAQRLEAAAGASTEAVMEAVAEATEAAAAAATEAEATEAAAAATEAEAAEPQADVCPAGEPGSSAGGHESEATPAKCVKISESESVPQNAPSCGAEPQGKQQHSRGDERRWRPAGVEAIHVTSASSLENQCAQQ